MSENVTEQEKLKRAKIRLIVVIVAAVVIPVAIFLGPGFMREMDRQRIVDEGVTADAVVIDLEDTGNRMNDNPEIRMTLDVTRKDGSTYRAVHIDYLSVVTLANYPPGAKVKVKYDAKDPSKVALSGI